MGKFNVLTGQYDTNLEVRSEQKRSKYKFNIITGKYEDESGQEMVSTQSNLGGLKPKVNLGVIPTEGIQVPPESKYSVLDILGIGQYTGAKFFDSLLDGDNLVDVVKKTLGEVGKVLQSTANAAIYGTAKQLPNENVPERLSYSDLIQQEFPDFAKNYPVTKSILGFVGDVVLDPTTYVTFGAKTGIQLAGKQLSNKGIDVIRGLNEIAQDGFKVTIKNPKTGLERVATFGIDEINKLNETKDIITLSYGALAGEEAALNKLNFIVNTQTKGFKGKIIDISLLNPAERNWNVEGNFLSLARQDPKLIQEGGDIGMYLNIPFSPKRITLIPSKTVDTVMEKLGLDKVRKGILDNLKESDTFTAFTRNFPLEDQQDYIKLRNTLYGQQNLVDHSLMTAIKDFSSLPKDSRTKLADLAIRIDQRILDKKGTLEAGQQLSDKAINATRQFHLNNELINGRINQDEFNAFSKFVDSHNKLAEQELISKMFKQSTNRDAFFSDKFKPTKSNDLDLAVMYALKIKAAGYDKAMKDFDEGLKLLYGTEKEGKLLSMTIPKSVQKDLDLIGYSSFSDKAAQTSHKVMDAIGKFNNVWKPLAYGIRPAAATKQYVANTLQSYTKIGASAFKNFDPRSFVDAAIMLADNSAYAKYIPTKLINAAQKFSTPVGKIIYAIDKFQPNLLGDAKMVNRLGETIPYSQLAEEAIQHSIYEKGMDVLSLDQTRNLRLEIAKANGFKEFQKEKWHEGFWTFLKESIPWINLPNHVENQGKLALYINARKLGMNPENAAKKTKEALFDYLHGTTQFENTYMKRFAPFYTFQRFAIPLIGSLIKEPGKAATLHKITKEFFEVYNLISNNQQLTEAQREVLPGYLLEQPNTFDGYSREGGVNKGIFRTFNSYLFTDWLSLLQTDVEGNVDIPKTVQKMTLAQITPLLKVPLEVLVNKNFFTDQPVKVGGKISEGELVNFYNDFLPDQVKELIGYEIRTDPQTGEKRGYVNPYLTYTMSSFAPFLNDYIAITKNDLNARESTMKLLAGIGTVKLDFQKEQHYRIKEWQEKVKDLQYEIRKAQLAGRSDIVSKDHEKLQELFKKISGVSNLNVQ